MSTVTCPECDERVQLKPGKSSVRCPACGVRFKVDALSREDEEGDREARKAKPKRKYREEWDDDDDDTPTRQPKRRGSLAWLWILLGVTAMILAGCGGLIWWVYTSVRNARDQLVQKAEEMKAKDQERMRQFNVQPGNPEGRPNPPPQPNDAAYPKRKPFDVDPQLLAKPSPVYLDDLQPFEVDQGSWPVGLHGALGYDNRWVCVNGTYYDHGIGMIPPDRGVARMSFALGGAAQRLKGQVALNDFWHDNDAWDFVTFAVYKDGKEVWRSPPMKKKKQPEGFDIDVTGARTITLETNAPKSAHDAHCVWLDPRLEK